MNLSALIPLVAAACNLVVTLFVASRGLRSGVKRVYCPWGRSLAVWNFGTFCLFVVKDRDAALYWARFLQFGVMFGTVSLFHLSLMMSGDTRSAARACPVFSLGPISVRWSSRNGTNPRR